MKIYIYILVTSFSAFPGQARQMPNKPDKLDKPDEVDALDKPICWQRSPSALDYKGSVAESKEVKDHQNDVSVAKIKACVAKIKE